jgi:pyridinium-3,5-biscarboxylic acid mononucleotide synthase
MRPEEVKDLLRGVAEGATRTEDALRALERLPVENLGFATLDTHRELRQGMPEAIYAEGKKAEEVVEIAARLLEATTGPVLATRVPEETARALIERFPEARHHESARLVVLRAENADVDLGIVAIVSAGTSDLPVADEAACVAEAVGASVEDRLREAHVVIVVAGMEGALASLVGGITPAPVIAVPTSVGYGASFEGLAALLAMLNSCAAGVVVTNIDNGFGAAAFALRLLRAMR